MDVGIYKDPRLREKVSRGHRRTTRQNEDAASSYLTGARCAEASRTRLVTATSRRPA